MDIPPAAPRKDIGEVLANLRRKREINQSDLARELAVSQAYISKLESGLANYEGLPVSTVERLGRALKFALDDWATILSGKMPSQGKKAQNKVMNYLRELPVALQKMIDEYARLEPDLLLPRWQNYLASLRFSGGSATPEQYWSLYLTFKNAGINPEDPDGGN